MKSALATFGRWPQTDMCIEEMAELTVELEHDKRGRSTREAVVEEIADVLIMCCQMALVYGEDDVLDVIYAKLERLEHRIEKAKEEKR